MSSAIRLMLWVNYEHHKDQQNQKTQALDAVIFRHGPTPALQ
jgi:hypothetical protein